MNNQSKTVLVLATLIILGVVALMGYGLYRAAAHVVASLLPAVGAPMLLGCGTAIVCALIVGRALSGRARRTGARESVELYERILADPAGAPDPDVERLLVTRANKRVLDRYLELRGVDEGDEPGFKTALRRLVVEMRRHAGHRDGMPLAEGVLDLLATDRGSVAAVPRSGEFKVVPQR